MLRLGEISYSLFLIHFPVILLVNAVVGHRWPGQPWMALGGMACAFALSLGAATILHRHVEMRAATWRAVLLLFMGLMACGTLSAT